MYLVSSPVKDRTSQLPAYGV